MAAKAREGKKDIRVRQKALDLLRYVPQKNSRSEIHALWEYVKDAIRYTRDINGVETIHDAAQVLEQRQGDCDDKAILLASMLESVGHPARFVAVGFGQPGDFSHVLVQTPLGNARDPRAWIWLETTEPVQMGWKPPNIKTTMTQDV